MIKTVIVLIACNLLVTGSAEAQGKPATNIITIENKSNLDHVSKVVAIPWQQVKAKYPAIDTNQLKVVDLASKKEITYQLEYAGQSDVQNLLVQVTINKQKSIQLALQKGKHAAFITKTYGRFVPERKEDFTWENDKIAFRMYGKELEKTPRENAYGIDVWVKRTDRMVINERYQKAEYHVDHGDGMDYYHVGFTLGAGNIMPYLKDSIWYSKNYTRWKLWDNGPLRTSFQLGYDAWDVAGKSVTAIKTITLDAGEQLNKISVQYSYEGNENLPVVIGIIKRPERGIALLDEQKGILGYWEPQHGEDGITAVGCIIPSTVKSMQVNSQQILAVSEVKKNEPFVYYTGAAWNKAGLIKSEQEWFDYLRLQQKKMPGEGLMIR